MHCFLAFAKILLARHSSPTWSRANVGQVTPAHHAAVVTSQYVTKYFAFVLSWNLAHPDVHVVLALFRKASGRLEIFRGLWLRKVGQQFIKSCSRDSHNSIFFNQFCVFMTEKYFCSRGKVFPSRKKKICCCYIVGHHFLQVKNLANSCLAIRNGRISAHVERKAIPNFDRNGSLEVGKHTDWVRLLAYAADITLEKLCASVIQVSSVYPFVQWWKLWACGYGIPHCG